MRSPQDVVPEYEKRLGVREGLFNALLSESDWSFVIKLHAFLEGATSHALAKSLGDDRLASVFANLEMSDAKRGKLAFLEALDLLDSPRRGYIRALSELRNRLVHQVTNVDFNLSYHLQALDRNQLAKARKTLGYFLYTGILELEATPERDFAEHPKLAMLTGALDVILRLYLRELEAGLANIHRAIGERLSKDEEAVPLGDLEVSPNSATPADQKASLPGR
jgi:energy-converting hydrogenase A subunit M